MREPQTMPLLAPQLTIPVNNQALAVRVADTQVARRLVLITRNGPVVPALSVFLTAVKGQARRLDR
jgi:hypothetical protein